MADLFALRGSWKRPATDEEVRLTRPYSRRGVGTPGKTAVLFIHGFTATPASFRAFAEGLAADGYTVSVPQLPGHASRPQDLQRIEWRAWLDAVLAEYDALASRCDTVFVVGLSLGGALALQLASLRETVAGLFLLAPAVYPPLSLRIGVVVLQPLLRGLGVRYWRHIAGDLQRKDAFEIGYDKTSLDGLVALNRCMKETRRILPAVSANVVLFQGRKDHAIPARKAAAILQQLGSARKELLWLDRSSHEIPRDHDAPRVLQIIRDRLTRSRLNPET